MAQAVPNADKLAEEQHLMAFRRDATAKTKALKACLARDRDQHKRLIARRDALPTGDAGEAKLSQSIIDVAKRVDETSLELTALTARWAEAGKQLL